MQMPVTIRERNSGEIIAEGNVNETTQWLEGNWYFAPEVVDMTRLKISNRTYTCPYKGVCFWVDLETGGETIRNVGWVYPDPKPSFAFIKDRIAFYGRDTAGTVIDAETV
jgi:uncharacterized protein (DUF427 family)